MASISLCMIVKNEAQTLSRCLSSILEAIDELIVVDTGSSDSTREIAQKFGARLYDFEWVDDFSAARNFAFSQGHGDYLMWMDADDVLKSGDLPRFQDMKKRLCPGIVGVTMPYLLNPDESGRPRMRFTRERLVRRDANPRWVGAVHEVIDYKGYSLYSDLAICHLPVKSGVSDRNLRIYQRLLDSGHPFDPRERYYYARELMENERYDQAIEQFNQFLCLQEGWLENRVWCCQDLAACLRALGRREEALGALMRSLSLDVPRAEILCEIGRHWMELEHWQAAEFWYRAALLLRPGCHPGGFELPDCYDFLPCLQLCVISDRLGRRQEALYYHKKCLELRPDHPSVRYNERYFVSLGLKEPENPPILPYS